MNEENCLYPKDDYIDWDITLNNNDKVIYICRYDGKFYKRVYPYTYSKKINCWINRSGDLTLKYFKTLVRENKIKLS